MRNEKLEEIKDPELRFAVEHSRDGNSYPDVLPENYMLKPEEKKEPDWYAKKKDPCKVTLHITSYRGISIGAVHFYGTIRVKDFDIVSEKNGKECWHGSHTYTIEVVRTVTKQMIEDDDERWGTYVPGCTTEAFDSVDEIKEIAKRIIKARLPWFDMDKLEIDDDYYDVDVRRYK